MGAAVSTISKEDFLKWTPEHIATAMKVELSEAYQPYTKAIIENYVRGDFLATLDDEEFEETCICLKIDNRLHQRILKNELDKILARVEGSHDIRHDKEEYIRSTRHKNKVGKAKIDNDCEEGKEQDDDDVKEKLWEQRFNELKAYKEQYGHFNVARKINLPLMNWCNYIRRRGKKTLTYDRIQRLNDIGFPWVCRTEDKWEKMFQQLKSFKEKHGHLNITANYGHDKNLVNWIHDQRKNLRRSTSDICKKRIKRLNEIGFTWGKSRRKNYNNNNLDNTTKQYSSI